MNKHTITTLRWLLLESTSKKAEALFNAGNIEVYVYRPVNMYVFKVGKDKDSQFRLHIASNRTSVFPWTLPWPPVVLSQDDAQNKYHSGNVQRPNKITQWKKLPSQLKEWLIANV